MTNEKETASHDDACRPDLGAHPNAFHEPSFRHDQQGPISSHPPSNDHAQDIARKSLVLARVTTVFTGVLVVANITYLFIAHGQLSEMKSSSAQTDRTIGVLNKQVQATIEGQRASVYFNKFNFDRRGDGNESANTWQVKPHMINGGNTVTTGLTGATACAPRPFDPEPYDTAGISDAVGSNDVLGPRAEADGPLCIPYVLTEKNIDEWASASQHFYIVGRVRYQDTLDRSRWHVTEFSKELTDMKVDGGNLFYKVVNVGSHNCIDEGCPDYKVSQLQGPNSVNRR